jgi:hypothetical protein
MRYLLILLATTLAFCNPDKKEDVKEDESSPIRFDGVYRTDLVTGKVEAEKMYYYLKFYEDGSVISVTSTGTVEQVSKWFNKNHEMVGKGKYDIDGETISFTTSSAAGELEYSGSIDSPKKLTLSLKSETNDEGKEHVYKFQQVESDEETESEDE